MSSVAATASETPGAMVTSRATTREVTAAAHRHTGARRPSSSSRPGMEPSSAAPIASTSLCANDSPSGCWLSPRSRRCFRRAAVVRGVGPDDAVAQRDGPGRLVDAASSPARLPVTALLVEGGGSDGVEDASAWAVPPGALAALLLMVDCLVVTVPPSRLAIPPPLTVPAEALPLLPRTALLFTVNVAKGPTLMPAPRRCRPGQWRCCR